MDMFRNPSKWLVAFVVSTFLSISAYIPAAQAAMIGTQAVIQHQQIEKQRQQLKAFLKRNDVRKQLIAWGVNPTDAQQRVDTLTDQQVQAMAKRMKQMPAGGDGVLGVLLLVFLVLLFTDIMGWTDIFPFVKHPVR